MLQKKSEVRKKFNLFKEKVVGMVATFSDFKDYETFISAARMTLQKRNDVTFLAIGDGKNLEMCRKMARGSLSDKIIFLGRQRDVESIVNIFDVGVLLTNIKTHVEGISNSIMEYMALGKPVVATNGGGTPELVIDGETGYLIPQKSEESLIEKINYEKIYKGLQRLFGWIFFPLKYLDFLTVNNPYEKIIASGFTLVAAKQSLEEKEYMKKSK